jgi:putative tryptophan/tyrosine transport system substrate-binding protein
MRRREFITLLGGASAWPAAAWAQQTRKIPRIGVLWHAASAEAERIPLAAFREGLKNYGYVPGQTILVEDRANEALPLGGDGLLARQIALGLSGNRRPWVAVGRRK